jgi:transposase
MMGRLNQDQGQLSYSFNHDEAVPGDHRVREIAAVLDLSWVHAELAPYYPSIGRPSIDPVLMIRLLILGYVFAIRSERQLCREVQVNLAYRWFCGLSIENRIPDHSAFSRARNERFRGSDIFRRVFERVVEACIAAGLVPAADHAHLHSDFCNKIGTLRPFAAVRIPSAAGGRNWRRTFGVAFHGLVRMDRTHQNL